MTSTNNLSEIDAILAPCYANMDKATLAESGRGERNQMDRRRFVHPTVAKQHV